MQIGAVYIRVSTDDQTEYSPEAQLRALREYAEKNDIIVPDEFVFRDEGISGKKADKRPGFQSMIAIAKQKPRPFDVILVHKFDRFARNREDSVVYKSLLRRDCGIRVVSISEHMEDDKMSVILEAMLEAMAEYYSLNLAEEVKKGLFEKARRGESIGKTPFGYNLENGKLIVNDQEANTVRIIFEKCKSESQTSIAKYLNLHNITTRRGGRWYNDTVLYVLTNPTYKGFMRYNYRKNGSKSLQNPPEEWIIVKSDHEPIISQQLFDEVQSKITLETQLNLKGSKNYEPKHWLQHIVRCAECGGNLGVSSSRMNGTKAFRCSRPRIGLCNINNTLTVNKLGDIILSQINDDFANSSELTIEKVNSENATRELDLLTVRLKKIENKQTLIKNAYLAQIDTMEEYKVNKNQIKKEEQEILEEIKLQIRSCEAINRNQIKLDNFISLLENKVLTEPEKNCIAKQFIKEIKFNLKTKDFQIIYYE